MAVNRIIRMLLLTVLVAMIGACSSKPDATTTSDSTAAGKTSEPGQKREILVFAAASLRESMQELGEAFEKQTGVHVLYNLAGSNDLARQILAAPKKADLFVSANQNWMDTVEKAGHVMAGTRRDLISNKLVVVASAQSEWKMTDPCELGTLTYKFMALGDPEAVPAGRYAKQWLSSIQCGGDTLWKAVQKRVSPAPDVRAALALVLADRDMLGIVYKSDQLAFSDKTRVLYEVTNGPNISYVAAQISGGEHMEDSRKFYDFLTGAEAQRVFEKHGFAPIPTKAP